MSREERWEWIAVSLVAGAIVLMVVLSLCVVDPMKYKIIAATAGEGLRAALIEALWDLAGRLIPLVVAVAGVLVMLLTLEVRLAAISRVLVHAPSGPFLLLASAMVLWFTHAYLFPGHLLAGDSGGHIIRLAHFGRGLQQGKVLFWDNDFYMGAPFLQFYAPLFFWLGGGLYALTDSVAWAAKLLLLLSHALSGVLFYAFLRVVSIERSPALVGAIGYAGAWAHGHLIFYKGVLPLAITMMLLPAVFFLAERLLQRPRLFGLHWVSCAVVIAGLITTHQPHGLVAGVYLAGYVLVRLVRYADRAPRFAVITSASLAGTLMSAFAVIPFLAEEEWVMASTGKAFFQFRLPTTEYIGHLLLWGNSQTTRAPESAAYVGITIFALGCTAVFFLMHARQRDHLSQWCAIILAGTILSIVWRGVLVRDVLFTLFFLSALAAGGAQRLYARFPAIRRLSLFVLLAVFLDLGPTALQPLARTDKAYLDAAGAYLAAVVPMERVMLTNTRPFNGENGKVQTDVGPGGGPIQYFPVQTIGGPHNHAATLVHNYAITILMRAERELRHQSQLSSQSEAWLSMLNVGRIVNDTGRSIGFPENFRTTREESPLGRVIKIPTATPAIFAPALTRLVPPGDVERPLLWRESLLLPESPQARATLAFMDLVYATMGYRPGLQFAERIPVRELAAGSPEERGTVMQGHDRTLPVIAIEQYTVVEDEVTLTLTSSSDGYVQLSHPWYPTLHVLHNGKPIEPLHGTLSLLVVPVDVGANVYRIVPYRSTLRIAFGWFGIGVLMLTALAPILHVLGFCRKFWRGADLW